MAEEPGILEDDPSEQLISPANVIAVIRLCWMYLERSGHIPVVHRRKAREGDDRRRVREKTRQRNWNMQQGDSCFCSDSQGILYCETGWKTLQPSSTNNSTETNQMHWCPRIRNVELATLRQDVQVLLMYSKSLQKDPPLYNDENS